MGKFVDLTGKKFGRLTVVKRAENRNGRTMWECTCECGARVPVRARNLQIGSTQSCGCLHREVSATPKKDLTGLRFGRLTVEKRAESDHSGIRWLCLCTCGRKKLVHTGALLSGSTVSCGCFAKERAAQIGKLGLIDLTGHRFGRWLVIARVHNDRNRLLRWACRCDCGKTGVVYGMALKSGQSQSCGCLNRERVASLAAQNRLKVGDKIHDRLITAVSVAITGKYGNRRNVEYSVKCRYCGAPGKMLGYAKFRRCRNCKNGHQEDSGFKSAMSAYRSGARVRKIKWKIRGRDYEYVRHMMKCSCVWCGKRNVNRYHNGNRNGPTAYGVFVGVGLDRIDNDHKIGYTLKNIMPCCKHCNQMRMARTVSEFLSHIALWASKEKLAEIRKRLAKYGVKVGRITQPKCEAVG